MNKLNATESLQCKGVTKYSSGSATSDWSLQLSVNLQEIHSAWWHLAQLMDMCLVWLCLLWTAVPVVNCQNWASLKSV